MLHIESCSYPRLDPTLQRPHVLVTLVDQDAGDTRRACFVRSTAVNDHVASLGDTSQNILDRIKLDWNRTGYAPGLEFARDC